MDRNIFRMPSMIWVIGERSELITFAASAEHERTGFD
jgi:hypothetical protein